MTAVRRATPEDARAIAAVKVVTWQATYVGVMPQPILDAMDIGEHERMWEQWLSGASNAVFVGEQDGTVVGFVNVGPSEHAGRCRGAIRDLCPPGRLGYRRGMALMGRGVAWLGERWPEAVLWVAEENPRARRFYELYGWVAETTRVVDVLPGATVSEVLYRLTGLDER